MSNELINADFSQRVVISTIDLPWIPSPQPNVERRMLDRIGGEVARATSLVRYAPKSTFPAHEHALGEEFLVLEGVFSDEHGNYGQGTYVRNPPGSRHSPRTATGCVILVKLRQMPPEERTHIVVDTKSAVWPRGELEGHARLPLYSVPGGEQVTIERMAPGVFLDETECTGGEEIFVLSGSITDDVDTYPAGRWIRNPPGYRRRLGSNQGSVYWMKRGHLPPVR